MADITPQEEIQALKNLNDFTCTQWDIIAIILILTIIIISFLMPDLIKARRK